jgi:hypothetical protein
MMKGLTKLIILAAVIFAVCIPVVSAFDVEGLTIDPSGSLTPNTPVTVSFKVGFSATGGDNFPATDDLVLTTDLANPKWTYTIIIDGVENPRNPMGGRTLDLSGFELSYPAKNEESLSVTVEGTAPTVDTTTNKTILDIHEVDSHGAIITSTQITKTTLVINPGDIQKAIADKTTNLQTYRSHIDEKSAIGIDTTDAEANYNDANAKISSAQARPATQYAEAFNDLAAAQSSIDAGETALDKSWAENVVANAQGPVDNVDKVIAWFKGNQSTSNDPQLSAIVAKREVAVNYISNANDFITNGKYSDARSKAAEAFAKGNESYTDALARQYSLMHGGFDIIGAITGIFKSGILVIVVGIVAVVLVAVGVIIYRKRSRWDELG